MTVKRSLDISPEKEKPGISGREYHVRSERTSSASLSPSSANPLSSKQTLTSSLPPQPPSSVSRHHSALSAPSTATTPPLSPQQWLNSVVSASPAEPSEELLELCETCGKQAAELQKEIVSRAVDVTATLKDYFLLRNSSLRTEHACVASVHQLSLKLYYRVLAATCRAEIARGVPVSSLGPLLANEKFQRGLLSCAFDLVVVSHGFPSLFPSCLPLLSVTAFDVGKVMESFVRGEEEMPGDLKRHLNACEEKVLESLAWSPPSSLFLCLANTRREEVVGPILRMGLIRASEAGGAGAAGAAAAATERMTGVGGGGAGAQFRSPTRDTRVSAFSSFASPVKRDGTPGGLQHNLHSFFASPQRPSPAGGGETCAELQFKLFSKKVLKLAAIRIKAMGERLHQPITVLEQVYQVVAHIVQHETQLMFNRHLDQIILSSIYGVCKVAHVNVTFKDIISQYRKQPNCEPRVFRQVFIEASNGHSAEQQQQDEKDSAESSGTSGDIIRFYNEVFVPATKSFLLQLSPSSDLTLQPSKGGSPPSHLLGRGMQDAPMELSPFKSSLPSHISPKRVSAAHNVFVSPLRNVGESLLLSPRSRRLFTSVGDSSCSGLAPYQSPSKSLAAINNHINGTRKLGRLEFTDGDSKAVSVGGEGSSHFSPLVNVTSTQQAKAVLSPPTGRVAIGSPHSYPMYQTSSISPLMSPVKRPRSDS